ncbi:MAG: MAPEG family protein [Gammaproteobacteria bacterium]|nr:MAPEG family protein [Gammaproteobacteria bacterium]MDH3749387.1 MAPEG family protein [Gammaproteobacteria bacterium]MDH3804071.1 MAPEG family protein [Gammaproteobacteria bacterium]
MKRNNIDPQRLTTPEKCAQIIPEAISYPAQNLRNLFELPVVFYALCLYLFVTAQVDAVYLGAAWVFFGFRVIHSAIHCSRNIVTLRFLAYMASALAVWFMVVRAALGFFA